jgi:hypothetical protein
MNRRPLAAVVGDLAAAVRPDPLREPDLRVTRLDFDVPVEVALGREGADLVLIADLPRWRWRSDFDREPGRLALHLEAVVS